MTEVTYVDPNDYVEFKDASKLQKDDYVFDGEGRELYLVLSKDYSSDSGMLICRDLQTGIKSTINPKGIQYYIGREGWTCRRYGEASRGVKISENDDKEISETLRLAGVKLNEGKELKESEDRLHYNLDISIYYNETGAYGTPASATLYSEEEGPWNICRRTIFNADDDLEEYIIDQCVQKANEYLTPGVQLNIHVTKFFRGGKKEEFTTSTAELYEDVENDDAEVIEKEDGLYSDDKQARLEDLTSVWLVDGSGSIEIKAPKSLVEKVAQSGDNELAVEELRNAVQDQISKYGDDELKDLIADYGVEDVDSMDRKRLENYALWILAWDAAERGNEEELDEAYTGLSSIRYDNRNARRNHIATPKVYSDGNLGLETNEEWFELSEKLKNYKDWKDREHSYGFIDINGKQIKFEIKEKMMPQKYVWLSRIK